MDKLERTETVVDYSTFSSDSFVFWTCVAEFAVSRIYRTSTMYNRERESKGQIIMRRLCVKISEGD